MSLVTFNPVRYYTNADVYHYTVDNRPLTDLASNDVLLQTAIDTLNTAINTSGGTPNSAVLTTKAALRTFTRGIATTATVLGGSARGDGQGDIYYYDSSDGTTADNGSTVIVATDGSRWKSAYLNAVNPVSAATLTGTEPVYVIQNGENVATTTSAIAALAPASNTNPSSLADAATLTGSEYAAVSQGAGVFRTTLTKIAVFVNSVYSYVARVATGAIARTTLAKLLDLPVSAKDFGAVGNTRIVTDGVMNSGSSNLSSATAAFSAADVGRTVDVASTTSVGVATLIAHGTITAVNSATSVTLSVNASANVTGASIVCGTDDGPSLTNFINYLCANWPIRGDIPAGVYYSSVVMPNITRPISIFGHSRRNSIIQFGANVSGQAFTLYNDGFNNEGTDLPQSGNVAWTSNSSVLAGVALRDFTIQGNRACTSLQHGLTFQGNVDWLDISHLDILYFRGLAINWAYTGTGSGQARGQAREGNLDNIKIRHCGDFSTNTSSFGIYMQDSPNNTSADSTNLFNINNVDVIFSYGQGFAVQDQRTVNNGNPIYGIQVKNMTLHDRYAVVGGAAGRLFSVVGLVTGCTFEINFAFSVRNDYAVEILTNAALPSQAPYANEFTFSMPNAIKGVTVGSGVGSGTLKLRNFFGPAEAVVFAGTPGGWKIECETDNVFQPITASMQLNGTNAITIPFGNVNNTNNLGTFMPALATNGTGDSMIATIFGITGTITRAGSIAATNDTYTFTPASSNSSFIPSGEYFSKINVNMAQATGVSGRYKYIPENRYGTAVSGTWSSGRLLQMWPWQFHIENATGYVRYTYGAPTADNLGNAIPLMQSTFVGVSATPSVTGCNKVVANYASATTITNFTGGIDGQEIAVVATNANCTIANNTNIHTSTGANVTMTTAQVLRFIYDTNVGKWCN